jgi:hypothetical protein
MHREKRDDHILLWSRLSDTHAKSGCVFLWHHDWIGHPLGFLELPNESSLAEPTNLFADCFSLWLRKPAHRLLYWFGFWVNIEGVLSEFRGNTWHVGWFPCKYFPALTEELDERAIL